MKVLSFNGILEMQMLVSLYWAILSVGGRFNFLTLLDAMKMSPNIIKTCSVQLASSTWSLRHTGTALMTLGPFHGGDSLNNEIKVRLQYGMAGPYARKSTFPQPIRVGRLIYMGQYVKEINFLRFRIFGLLIASVSSIQHIGILLFKSFLY